MFFWFCFYTDTSIVPPLIYAVMGSSRDIAIGPVAVVSMLLSSLVTKVIDPVANPHAYRDFIFTVTFFTGIFQAAFGIFRCWFSQKTALLTYEFARSLKTSKFFQRKLTPLTLLRSVEPI